MGAGAPIENKNAEKWTFDEAENLFKTAADMSKDKQYDFIGEIARDLGVYRELFSYLSDKFKELKHIYNQILGNLEANCFSHAKKGDIREATAIVNLKSNYKWTDRIDQKTEHSGNITVKPPKFDAD